MESGRKSRGLMTRKAEKKEARPVYNMKYVSLVDIPEHVQKEGFRYFWERTSIKGAADSALDNSIRNGWNPVPLERDPAMFSDILDRNPLSRKFMCKGDVMLLEKEEELCEQEELQYKETSVRRVEDSQAYNFRKSNPGANSIGTVDR